MMMSITTHIAFCCTYFTCLCICLLCNTTTAKITWLFTATTTCKHAYFCKKDLQSLSFLPFLDARNGAKSNSIKGAIFWPKSRYIKMTAIKIKPYILPCHLAIPSFFNPLQAKQLLHVFSHYVPHTLCICKGLNIKYYEHTVTISVDSRV